MSGQPPRAFVYVHTDIPEGMISQRTMARRQRLETVVSELAARGCPVDNLARAWSP